MMTQMLMGIGRLFVVNDLTTITVNDTRSTEAHASAHYRDDGRITDHYDVTVNNWGSPTTSGAGIAYWVRATLTSGDTPTGSALNTWHQLSGNPYWTISSGSGVKESNLAIQIAFDSAGSNILDTHTLILRAEVTS